MIKTTMRNERVREREVMVVETRKDQRIGGEKRHRRSFLIYPSGALTHTPAVSSRCTKEQKVVAPCLVGTH